MSEKKLIKEEFTLELSVVRAHDDTKAGLISKEIMSCIAQAVSWARWYDGVITHKVMDHTPKPVNAGDKSSKEATT